MRQLSSVSDTDLQVDYTYDDSGIRTSKTVNGVTTQYNTKDGVILAQSDGENTLYFQYDTNGVPFGFVWNGTQYYYVTNQMGDVMGITDDSGNLLVQYSYDAWGKLLGTTLTDANDQTQQQLAALNPLLYRGYYYDSDTELYYLQSRYYDPYLCRFINSDVLEISGITKDTEVGTNMFAYCNNDPVNTSDPAGDISHKVIQGIFGGIMGAITRYISDLINVKCFKGRWSKITTYLLDVVDGVWSAVTNRGFFKGLLIAIGKSVIEQLLNKIIYHQNFSALKIFEKAIDYSITYVISKKLKIKSPSKIKDIKKKARSLGIKGAKKLTAYLNKQIFKVKMANITLSSVRSIVKSVINNVLKQVFHSNRGRLLT